ncbi:MAG TPA: NEW3 domain-containing protein, partial [Candidatus Limnocylindria bacterium]
TGKEQLTFTTPDQRLNASANAGSATDLQVVVTNTGTTPLRNVTLSGSGPSEWKVTFEPATIDAVAPNDTATAVAHVTPSGSAVAGDYSVSLTARTEGADESMDIRVTVETPPIWGLLGIGLILATLAGMVWVFRRFGRR